MEDSRRSLGKSRRSISAFSLIDALVASSLVIGIGALSLPSFVSTVVINRSVERAVLAREVARIVIENVRDVGVVNLVDGNFPLTRFGPVEALNVLPNASGSVTITTPSTSVRKVVIRVQWTSGVRQGRQRTYNTVTLLTPGGVSP
jgi:type II secretory pathway pseudopilin PulG